MVKEMTIDEVEKRFKELMEKINVLAWVVGDLTCDKQFDSVKSMRKVFMEKNNEKL